MNERILGMLAVIIVALLWLNAPVVERDSTQCDITADTSALINELAGVKYSLSTEMLGDPKQFNHFADASKMVDHIPDVTKMIEHEKLRREIIIFTRPNCPPCDQWKRIEQAKFEADGWSVAYCVEHSYGLTPTFIIERNGRTTEHRGYLPFSKVDEVAK